MKGNKKALIVVVLLLLIAVGFTSYAIYKTSQSAEATVTAAKWEVVFKDGSDTMTANYNIVFSGTDCQNNHVAQGKIAPGATCTKTITLDAGQTEVDVAYTATAGAATVESPLTTTNANQFTVSLLPASGTIAYNAATKTADLTLTVTWAGVDDSDTDTVNAADTALQGATITVPVTLVAKQVPVSATN